MNVLGLILARKGSKGLKNKNLKNINGYSLIELAIFAALESKVITEVLLSTDYSLSEVGKLASRYYVKRPKYYCYISHRFWEISLFSITSNVIRRYYHCIMSIEILNL